LAQYSNTPALRVAGFEDDDEGQGQGQEQEQERSALYRILSLRAEALSFGRST
jgi:hypothetical protein